MPTQTNIGRVQPLFRGNYDPLVTYNRLDNVYYEAGGNTWICLQDGTRDKTPIPDSAYWQLVSAKGDTGAAAGFATPTADAQGLETGARPSVTVEADGSDTNKRFIFHFGLPAGPIGPTGVQNASAMATNYTEDGTRELTSEDPPWTTAALDTSNYNLNFTIGIPPGADGSGNVDTVDGHISTNGNVRLGAVSGYYNQLTGGYAWASTVEGVAQAQEQARQNINAQIAGDYIANPPTKENNTFLCWGGVSSPSWFTTSINQVTGGGQMGQILRKQNVGYGWTPVYEVPAGGSVGAVLMKSDVADYVYEWSPAITSADIDLIMA